MFERPAVYSWSLGHLSQECHKSIISIQLTCSHNEPNHARNTTACEQLWANHMRRPDRARTECDQGFFVMFTVVGVGFQEVVHSYKYIACCHREPESECQFSFCATNSGREEKRASDEHHGRTDFLVGSPLGVASKYLLQQGRVVVPDHLDVREQRTQRHLRRQDGLVCGQAVAQWLRGCCCCC